MASGTSQVDKAVRTAGQYAAFAHETLTVTNAVKVLTASTYVVGSRYSQAAYITIEDADVRYTYDGTTPSATVGHLLTSGSSIALSGHRDISTFKAYRAAGIDATLRITYEG